MFEVHSPTLERSRVSPPSKIQSVNIPCHQRKWFTPMTTVWQFWKGYIQGYMCWLGRSEAGCQNGTGSTYSSKETSWNDKGGVCRWSWGNFEVSTNKISELISNCFFWLRQRFSTFLPLSLQSLTHSWIESKGLCWYFRITMCPKTVYGRPRSGVPLRPRARTRRGRTRLCGKSCPGLKRKYERRSKGS